MSDFTYEYLPFRGITKKIVEFFDVKTRIDKDGKPQGVCFRQPNGAVKLKNFDPKMVCWSKEHPAPEPGLLFKDKFAAGSHKYVTITEGGEDALSLYQVLGSPVVSVQCAVTSARDIGADRSWLQSFERIYLAFDNDEAGREALRSSAKLFDYSKIYVVKFSNRKDANEYLQAGEVDDLRNIWWNSKKYLPETVISSFAEFKKILSEPTKLGVPYPFKTLTDMTYGIRTSESVLITAQEGIGKTELMHAIEFKLLKETKDAIGAIFLEEPKKRHLQALGGLEIGRPAHLPDSGCSEDQIIHALEKVLAEDDRLHIYSHFGSDDPAILLDTIRFLVTARNCKYILLDHITMAVSGLSGEDERRALDYLSTRLEMMVKELDFALIIVSHVNDEGLTRGSRYISKVADIRIDAKRNLLSADPVDRNTTHLSVSKNRFCGRTGPAGKVLFDLDTFTFKEL